MPLYKEHNVDESNGNVAITTTRISGCCNRCGVSFDNENTPMELQEMLHWEHTCGYGSLFGDGTKLEVTLCETCILAVLSPYVNYGYKE